MKTGHMCITLPTGLELLCSLLARLWREIGEEYNLCEVYSDVDIKIAFTTEEDLKSESWGM